MNKTVNKLYTDYLELTSDKAAAAALTLADVMQRTLDAPKTQSAAPITMTPGKPLTVPEVAKFLQVAPTKSAPGFAPGACKATMSRRPRAVGPSIGSIPTPWKPSRSVALRCNQP